MIKLQIIGNLGGDCIVKEVNGKNVINFNMAHTEKFKDGQGNLKEKTTWVNCAYWTDKTALGQYLKKGKMVYAEGFPEVEGYLNKENQPAATLRMRVMNIQLLGGGDGGPQNNTGNQIGSSAASTPSSSSAISSHAATRMSEVSEPVDDLPF